MPFRGEETPDETTRDRPKRTMNDPAFHMSDSKPAFVVTSNAAFEGEMISSPPNADITSSRHVAVNRLSSVEAQLALLRASVEENGLGVRGFEEKLEVVEEEFAGLKRLESVPGQLERVEARLQETERLLVEGDGAMQQMRGALSAVEDRVETVSLALEVVEQSLEYFEETDETIETLRSRLDDFDVGMENSELKMAELVRKVDELNVMASEAHAVAQSTSAEVAELKRGASVFPLSGASTPGAASSGVSARSSEARVKAAVHTLSDGYRSLHKAMGLMYDEQTDLANRVTRAGLKAQRTPAKKTLAQRIRDSMSVEGSLASFPLAWDGDNVSGDDDVPAAVGEEHVVASNVLVASQAKDLARSERRVEVLEEEVRQLREILCSLVRGSAGRHEASRVVVSFRLSPMNRIRVAFSFA